MEYTKQESWIQEAFEKALAKIKKNAQSIGADFPEIAKDGVYRMAGHPSVWTNGFWPGILWLAYAQTGDEALMRTARACEEKMDEILSTPDRLAHDVGFMWTPAAVADYKLTGDEAAKGRGIRAAMSLASRFQLGGGFIRSWENIPQKDTRCWTIADTMMNLPILYWASETVKDDRFLQIAMRHTDTMMKHLIRPDGSVNHIIKLDPYTGAVIADREDCLEYTQGCSVDSSWTRGQAWVIYGMALGSRYTQRADCLDAAKSVAHYFLAALDESGVPPVDFRAEAGRMGRDSSAGAIAACGLLEIADQVDVSEKELYRRGAKRIIKGLIKECAEADSAQNMLAHGCTHYRADQTADIGLIYGDYFYTEALYRLCGGNVIFW